MELLLLSNSANHGAGFLEHAMPTLLSMLDGRAEIVFVPFARADHDAYTQVVTDALADVHVGVRGLHAEQDPCEALRQAPAVFVGGGNTFRLLRTMQRLGALDLVRARVRAGMPYIGSSAGTNLAAPSIRTTNDMPIVEPAGFTALGLVPFQINAHYLDADPQSRHMGETREARIAEFLEENDVDVLGLREGSWLRVSGRRATVAGVNGAKLFRRAREPQELPVDSDVSVLLDATPEFDAAGGQPPHSHARQP
jgi:dipeptidase E